MRLDRLELWNWGTFHGDLQVLDTAGDWSLLIGDNGSGKSTAIDALRTLLVPPRMLNFNDAAGDGRRGGRDRTRRSYVRGAWATTSTADATAATTQYLRAPGALSAIAAIFADPLRGEAVTLAQVLWEHDEQIRELYFLARARSGLRALMEGCAHTAQIRQRARQNGWMIEDSFAPYAERMRQWLHIPGDRALEVFNRAIGMKEVVDIDAFVRQYLLPPSESYAFIRDTVLPHYRTLLDCWQAIERAENQIAMLRPVAQHGHRIAEGEQRIAGWAHLQQAAAPCFQRRHLALLQSRQEELGRTLAARQQSREHLRLRLDDVRKQRDSVCAALNANQTGVRLQAIERDLDGAEKDRNLARQRRERIIPTAHLLGATAAIDNAAHFAAARAAWETRQLQESGAAAAAEERRATRKHEQDLALALRADKFDERQSAERHRVNIPRQFLHLRSRLTETLHLTPGDLPFAGELMEVNRNFEPWTGAIERLLRSFGLSLLVPEDRYHPVAGFINANWLGIRLTFHRVPATPLPAPALSNDLVPGRLDFLTGHPLHLWLATELVRRFNHRCCESVAELERCTKGLTKEGLIRDGFQHTKDDRHHLDDVSQRILGWSTERKLAALQRDIEFAEQTAAAAARQAANEAAEAQAARSRAAAAAELLRIQEFSEIDLDGWNRRILELHTEQAALERSADTVRILRERQRGIEASIASLDRELQTHDRELGALGDQLQQCQALYRQRSASPLPEPPDESVEEQLSELAAPLSLTLENVDALVNRVYQALQGRINHEHGRINAAHNEMIEDMAAFLAAYPEFKQELRASRDYLDSFAAALQRIEHDDLPRHRERFEQYLNENLVGNLLMLNSRLEEHQRSIQARIAETNTALQSIDYGDNTYVQLHLVHRPNPEAQSFRQSLRGCFEYGTTPRPEDRARTFTRVRALIEEFQREPEKTQRFADTRTWFASAVRELRRGDDSELNYQTTTAGRSGGQKAKLAFTILASALSAQYGLANAPAGTPQFRLVVIDEVFARTDESNSTRAMQLFAQLGFQLLIVGPFDAKAKLALPFVKTIHLATNPGGDRSRLMSVLRSQVDESLGAKLAE